MSIRAQEVASNPTVRVVPAPGRGILDPNVVVREHAGTVTALGKVQKQYSWTVQRVLEAVWRLPHSEEVLGMD